MGGDTRDSSLFAFQAIGGPEPAGVGRCGCSNNLCGSLICRLQHLIHVVVQSTVLIHSANVVSGIWNIRFNSGISIA